MTGVATATSSRRPKKVRAQKFKKKDHFCNIKSPKKKTGKPIILTQQYFIEQPMTKLGIEKRVR